MLVEDVWRDGTAGVPTESRESKSLQCLPVAVCQVHTVIPALTTVSPTPAVSSCPLPSPATPTPIATPTPSPDLRPARPPSRTAPSLPHHVSIPVLLRNDRRGTYALRLSAPPRPLAAANPSQGAVTMLAFGLALRAHNPFLGFHGDFDEAASACFRTASVFTLLAALSAAVFVGAAVRAKLRPAPAAYAPV